MPILYARPQQPDFTLIDSDDLFILPTSLTAYLLAGKKKKLNFKSSLYYPGIKREFAFEKEVNCLYARPSSIYATHKEYFNCPIYAFEVSDEVYNKVHAPENYSQILAEKDWETCSHFDIHLQREYKFSIAPSDLKLLGAFTFVKSRAAKVFINAEQQNNNFTAQFKKDADEFALQDRIATTATIVEFPKPLQILMGESLKPEDYALYLSYIDKLDSQSFDFIPQPKTTNGRAKIIDALNNINTPSSHYLLGMIYYGAIEGFADTDIIDLNKAMEHLEKISEGSHFYINAQKTLIQIYSVAAFDKNGDITDIDYATEYFKAIEKLQKIVPNDSEIQALHNSKTKFDKTRINKDIVTAYKAIATCKVDYSQLQFFRSFETMLMLRTLKIIQQQEKQREHDKKYGLISYGDPNIFKLKFQ